MTKEEALEIITMLSAVESWSFSVKSQFPDYLGDRLAAAMDVLERIILKENKS